MGLSQITSLLSPVCHNLEGSLAAHEETFCQKILLFCRLAAGGRDRVAGRKDTDFVGLVVRIVKRVAITLTDMLTSTAKPK